MTRFLLTLSALLMMSSVAMAVPFNSGNIPFSQSGTTVNVHWEANDIGGGLTRFDVFLDDPTDAKSSYFLQALTFTGTINQDASGSKNNKAVDSSVIANDPDDPPANYDPAIDSYYFPPFVDNLVAPGFTDNGPVQGLNPRSYAITAGSGGGSTLDFVQIAQIVASGNVNVAGSIGRGGATLPGNGTMSSAVVPEPSTFVLLGMGVVGMAGFVRRKRNPV